MSNTLWVFGDSYAGASDGWPLTLSHKLNCNLKCYGHGATSLFWSYTNLKNMLPQIKDNDYVVFIITMPGRLYCSQELTKDLDKIDITKEVTYPITGLEHILSQIENVPKNSNGFNFLNAAKEYYELLYNHSYQLEVHQLLTNEIYGMISNKKGYIISLQDSKNNDLCLFDVVKHQSKYIGKMFDKEKKQNGILQNHLTPDNNSILADFFFDKLTKGFTNITLDNFEQIKYADIKKYYDII